VPIAQTAAETWRFSIFQNSGRHHLGFVNFRKFNSPLRHVPNFLTIRCGDMAIFFIFPDGGCRCWTFKFLKFFTVRTVKKSTCITMSNFLGIGQTFAEIWRSTLCLKKVPTTLSNLNRFSKFVHC